MPDVVFTGATPNFSYPPTIPLVVDPAFATAFSKEIAIADFNGDGKLDALITFIQISENKPAPFRLLLGDGAGGFVDASSVVLGANGPVAVFARQLLTADFNGDGRADVFVADHGFDQPPFPGYQNSLLLSTGATGLMNATARLPVLSDFSHSAATADIDRDGDLDIFVANLGQAEPYFLINDGAAGFVREVGRIPSATFGAGAAPSTVLFFDADGDGRADLLLGDVQGTSGSTILRNDGTGRFMTTLTVAPGPTGSTPANALDVRAADFNGDGRLDLILSYEQNGDQDGRLQILINRPDGFVDETATRMTEATNPTYILRTQIVDLNGDGFLDIFANDGTDRPVYLNDGTGHFVRMPLGFVPGNLFDDVHVADFNGDGRMDLFAVRNETTLSVRLGRDAGLSQTGGDGADGFMGDGDNESISGLAGDDVIFSAGGADTASGGVGNDTIVGGAGVSYLRGDDGADSMAGGTAFDDINGNMGNDTVATGAGEDYCVGGKDNDSLSGGADYDLVYGNLGADTCEGGDGNDIVRGGQESDVTNGGNGDDFVSGDKGDDTMSGGSGADIFHTFGDAGIDRVVDFNLAQGDRVQLDPGTVFTVAQAGADTVINMTGGGQMILVGVAMNSLTGNWIFGA